MRRYTLLCNLIGPTQNLMIADKPPALAEPTTAARFSPRLLDIAIGLIALLAIAGLWIETIYHARDNRAQAVQMT